MDCLKVIKNLSTTKVTKEKLEKGKYFKEQKSKFYEHFTFLNF